jgi:hypothetical protein
MKKYFKIAFIFFLLSISKGVFAENVVYSNPTFWEISPYLTPWDIEPGYNPQPSYRIWVYDDYIINGDDLATAQKFCSILGYTYISYILETTTVRGRSALYYPTGDTWWDYNRRIREFSEIVCDNNITDPGTWGTGTGSTIIINNIDESEGINKPIFDNETIIEIYKIEAVAMVFILLYTFFMRLIWRNPKRKQFWF